MSGIYVASKAVHGGLWRMLRSAGDPICSSWIDESEPGQTKNWSDLWDRVVTEVVNADALVHLLFPGETPKGALVEVGVALGCTIPVYWVGPRYQCCAHPLVTMCHSVSDAFELALTHCGQDSQGGVGSAQAQPNCAVDLKEVPGG